MDRLVLCCFGGFRARLESGASVDVSTRKGQALLAYLACSHAQSHSRQRLATMFWGDLPQSRARHNLRQTLFMLRGALAARRSPILRGDSDRVSLDRAGLVVDALDFERLTKLGTVRSLEQAGVLYQGDFLAGIGAGDLEFEEWLRDERERLRTLAVRASSKLAALQRGAGLTEHALRSAERALTLDPTDESILRELMRLYVSAGWSSTAMRQYRRCAQTLQRELGVEPEATTMALVREISSGRAPA